MQNIPDKDLDNLFKERFKDAEMEPSMDLWSDIESRLGKKPKRVFPVYWSAAILVAALTTAGLLFRSNLADDAQLVAYKTTLTKLPSKETLGTFSDKDIVRAKKSTSVPTQATGLLVHKIKTPISNSVNKRKSEPVQPLVPNIHLHSEDLAPMPTLEAKINLDKPAEEQVVFANADVHQQNERGRGIKNVGELINYVIEKVDKREDKLIEFETDDDESSLIGLNIGMIKFKQKKHK